MKQKKRLIWVGDACCHTGFARVTHNVLEHLKDTWDVTVVGINYSGDPHNYPYPIFPAKTSNNHDIWGAARLASITESLQPDVVVVNNDPWNVIRFVDKFTFPVVSYMPIDSPNMRQDVATKLSNAAMNILYTRFGTEQLRDAGTKGPMFVVPHGVDTKLYFPRDKNLSRRAIGRPEDIFVFGNVNRNQPRKRLDLSIAYFAKWIKEYNIPENVFLHLHCGLKDVGWDLIQLAGYYGVKDRVSFTDRKMTSFYGAAEAVMPFVYSNFDVQISTTLGEGWGLTAHEGMACGIPQIVPEWSALGEWAKGAVRFVPVTSYQASTALVNTIGGIAGEEEFINAMDEMYKDKQLREDYSKLAYKRATEERFSWSNVAACIGHLLNCVVEDEDPISANPEFVMQQDGLGVNPYLA